MNYVENLGYCSDSEHHYYSSAKEAFNSLNTHQRSLFTTNSAYLTEWTRLSTWASKNGDVLGSNNLLTKGQHNNLALMPLKDNNSLIFAIIFSLVGLSSIGAIYVVRKRKE